MDSVPVRFNQRNYFDVRIEVITPSPFRGPVKVVLAGGDSSGKAIDKFKQ